jgi:hAT family C-terminal dimerisation region
LYLKEPLISKVKVIEYWKIYKLYWPNLTRIAFDFLVIPAMSFEYKRVFSSYVKEITLESSRLLGLIL